MLFRSGPGNVVTNAGDLSITATGSISGAGVINAGTGNVTLVSYQSISLNQVAGQVRGTKLDAQAFGTAPNGTVSANTSVDQLTALASGGSVIVNETDDLTVVANGLIAATGGNIAVSAAGNITLAANVTGDDSAVVLLSSANGNVSTTGGAAVFGSLLDVRAKKTSTLNKIGRAHV